MSYIIDEIAYNSKVNKVIAERTQAKFLRGEGNQEVMDYLYANQWNSFCKSLLESFKTYNKLSDNQVNAIKAMIEKSKQPKLSNPIKAGAHIGTVGAKKVRLTLTLVGFTVVMGSYGLTAINRFKDFEGNTVIYKGASFEDYLEKEIVIECTIKDHSEYKGVNQTIIIRPKVL